MISAVQALRLPCAQLTPAQRDAADAVERALDAYVEKHMERRGAYGFKTRETDPNVIAEVNARLKAKGWEVQLQPDAMPSAVNPRQALHVGWKIDLAPSAAAYVEAAGQVLFLAPEG